MDHFTAHHAPYLTPQTGGKRAVFENGVAVFAALLHQVCGTAPLTTDHLVITFPDVGVFGIQIRPGFRTFQDDLIVVIVHITQRIHRTDRRLSTFRLLLVQLHFVSKQATVALVNIDIARKGRIVRIITFCAVGINGDG